jgi:hypothetical protein
LLWLWQAKLELAADYCIDGVRSLRARMRRWPGLAMATPEHKGPGGLRGRRAPGRVRVAALELRVFPGVNENHLAGVARCFSKANIESHNHVDWASCMVNDTVVYPA